MRIHVTDRHTFKYCRRLFHWAVVKQLEPKDHGKDYFYFGAGGHRILQDAYAKKLTGQAYLDRVQQEMPVVTPQFQKTENVQLFYDVLVHYKSRLEQDLDEYEVLTSEEEHTCPIETRHGSTGILVATIDVELRNRRTKKIRGMDHKFLSQFPNPDILQLDDQMTAYYWILVQKHGYDNVEGFFYNVIRKAVPSIPWTVYNGARLSKDKTQDTTWALYMQSIESMGLDPTDYTEMLNYLRENEPEFHQRHPIYRGRRELNIWYEDLRAEFDDMMNPELVYYPNPGPDCAYCDFARPCKSLREGGSPDVTLSRHYQKKTSHI